ncbi:MAG TPA: RluA family pseudouridine synthase [Myxococcales bacterium]
MTTLNHGWEYREQLDARARGLSVLGYLASRYRHSTEATWRERIARGEVLLDGAVASPESPLRPGQLLCWMRPPWEEPAVPTAFEDLFEDRDLLAVCKPSGLPCEPAGGDFLENTLLRLVQRRDPDWAPMHRLGRGTSGVVLFARTGEARAHVQAEWRAHRVEKTYRTLASGRLPAEPFPITTPIGLLDHPVLGRIHAATPSGRSAHSEVRLLAPRGEDSLCEVRILTGRPHQIRIHLAACGHPLVGDPLYGAGGLPRPDALPGDLGYHLHAWRLKLSHPRTGRPIEFEAPLPPLLE